MHRPKTYRRKGRKAGKRNSTKRHVGAGHPDTGTAALMTICGEDNDKGWTWETFFR